MSVLPWRTRKSRLATLLNSQGNEDADALALDRLLHGQSVIGKTGELFCRWCEDKTWIDVELSKDDGDRRAEVQRQGSASRRHAGVWPIWRGTCRIGHRIYACLKWA